VATSKGPVERKVCAWSRRARHDMRTAGRQQDAVLLAVFSHGSRSGQHRLAWLSLTQGVIGLAQCSEARIAVVVEPLGAGRGAGGFVSVNLPP